MDNALLKRYEEALHAAAKAGDVEAARTLAGEMRNMLRSEHPEAMILPTPTEEGARMAARETTPTQAFLMTAGREGLDKPAMGMKQAVLGGVEALGGPAGVTARQELSNLAKQEAEKNIADIALRNEHPIASTLGGAAPYMAVPGSSGVMGGAALIGGTEALKYGSPEDRLKRGLLGGTTALAGGVLGKAVGGSIAPVSREALGRAKANAIRIADKINYKLRLSEASGSRTIGRFEDMASRTPGGMGVMQKFADENAKVLNAHAAKAIGEKATELSDEVFARATDRIKGVFNSVDKLPGRPIAIPKAAAGVSDDVLRTTKKMLPNQVDQELIKYANQLKALANNKGRIDGETYQLLRSGLSESAFDATGVNKVLYGKLVTALDRAADSSLKMSGRADLANKLVKAREQWGNLQVLQKGLAVEGGNVSAKRVATILRQQNPSKFKTGAMKDNPLYDVAQLGENMDFLVRGSQTYERQSVMGPGILGERIPWAYGWAQGTTSPLLSAYPQLLSANPIAARTMLPIGDVAGTATRAGVLAANPLEQYK